MGLIIVQLIINALAGAYIRLGIVKKNGAHTPNIILILLVLSAIIPILGFCVLAGSAIHVGGCLYDERFEIKENKLNKFLF
jgi:hypothetical protein